MMLNRLVQVSRHFEKLIAGVYLGDTIRLVLVDLYNDGFLFEGKNIKSLQFQTSWMHHSLLRLRMILGRT